MKKESFLNEDSQENQSMSNRVAKMVSDIAMNGMQVLEVKSYPINDKIKKLKKHSFKAYSLEEIKVVSITTSKEGYLTVNGDLDIPLFNLKRDSEGPWYYTNKDEAIQKVTDMNKLEYDAISEILDELTAAEEYMKDIVANNRY